MAGAARFVYSQNYRASDFFTFWLAAHMQWTGEDPYSPDDWVGAHHQFENTWIPNETYPYPLSLAFLQAPLGLLPLDRAFIIWMALSAVLLGLTVFLVMLTDWHSGSKHYVLSLIIGLILFRPVWVTIRNGQLSALLLFMICLAALLWEERRWLLGGLLLAVVGLKPTLGLPLLGLMTVWLSAQRHWRAVGGLALGGVLLLIVAQVQNPGWVTALLSVGSDKLSDTFGYSPTVWGLAGRLCGHALHCTLLVGGGGTAALVVLGLYLAVVQRSLRPLTMFSLFLPLAILVMPYGWAYDQALLILPLTYVTLRLARAGFNYLIAALLFFWVDVLAIILLLVAVEHNEDTLSAVVSLAVLGLSLWGWRLALRPSAAATALAP